jgi:hypothetical protein
MSGRGEIDTVHVERAIAWTRYQLSVREYLYPQDQETAVGRLESGILRTLDKNAPTAKSDRDLTTALHVGRRSMGSYDDYNRARNALLKPGKIMSAGKNWVGRPLYCQAVVKAIEPVADRSLSWMSSRIDELLPNRGGSTRYISTCAKHTI